MKNEKKKSEMEFVVLLLRLMCEINILSMIQFFDVVRSGPICPNWQFTIMNAWHSFSISEMVIVLRFFCSIKYERPIPICKLSYFTWFSSIFISPAAIFKLFNRFFSSYFIFFFCVHLGKQYLYTMNQ